MITAGVSTTSWFLQSQVKQDGWEQKDTAANHQVRVRRLSLGVEFSRLRACNWLELGQSQHAVRGQTAVDIRSLISLPGDAASDLGHGAVRAGRPAAPLTRLYSGTEVLLCWWGTHVVNLLDSGVTTNTTIPRVQCFNIQEVTPWALALNTGSLHICNVKSLGGEMNCII